MKRRMTMLLFMTIAGAAIQGHSMYSRNGEGDSIVPGINQGLALRPIHDLPEWTRIPLEDDLPAAYQVQGAIVDLNGDGEAEILLAAAPPSPDLHIPDRNFSVVTRSRDRWVELPSDRHCRPYSLGAFRHEGWWDIRCREGRQEYVLRWDGDRYR